MNMKPQKSIDELVKDLVKQFAIGTVHWCDEHRRNERVIYSYKAGINIYTRYDCGNYVYWSIRKLLDKDKAADEP